MTSTFIYQSSPEAGEVIIYTPSGKSARASMPDRFDRFSPNYAPGGSALFIMVLNRELSQKALDRYAQMKAERLCRARRTTEICRYLGPCYGYTPWLKRTTISL